ncbi:unnamed protein product [Notodromas monacha]|uniref:GST N-terminal domain-containing protein n=1 Tax=Notodromas monacha TaxID=399045 RepID=A0A7R9BY83_9CRUS|nr:unnamed protein product [Notodromas monacha]CAG0922622.1 unnamed protein product [Notodromas monacha]
MGLRLYYLPHSPPCRAVKLLAAELGLDLEIKPVNLWAGDHLKDEFLALNPTHTVPTLDDNGFVIWDSHAILQYLMNKYGKDSSDLYPQDPEKRAVIDNRLCFDLGTLNANIRDYYVSFVFTQIKMKDYDEIIETGAQLWFDDLFAKITEGKEIK